MIKTKTIFKERLVRIKELASLLGVKEEWIIKKTKNNEIPSIRTDDKVIYSTSHVIATIAERDPEKAYESLNKILQHPLKEGEEPLFPCITPLVHFIQSKMAKAQKELMIMHVAPPNWPSSTKTYLSKSNYGNGNFRINYADNSSDPNCVLHPTDYGPHDVELHDSFGDPILSIGQTDPASNVPSTVQEYGIRLEYALSRYVQAGFPNPKLPGYPIEVYIANLNVRGQANTDKSIWFYSGFEPSSLPMEHCINHEFFHLIQDVYYFEYNVSSGNINRQQISSPAQLEDFYFFLEGQAEWAPQLVNKEDRVYDVYFNTDTTSVNPPEKWSLISPDYSSGCESSVFWKYYSEQLTSLPDPL